MAVTYPNAEHANRHACIALRQQQNAHSADLLTTCTITHATRIAHLSPQHQLSTMSRSHQHVPNACFHAGHVKVNINVQAA